MKSPGFRSAIIILVAGGLLAVPTILLLNGRGAKSPVAPATPTAPAIAAALPSATAQLSATPRASASATPTPIVASVAPTHSATPAPTHSPTPAPPAPTPPPATASVPAFSHVFVIVMENHEYGDIVGNPAAPYINSLANAYGLATNYYAASHPSLPNYLALTAGSTFGITSDCTTCYVSATNIADQVESSGRSWKAYMEDMPAPCYLGAWSGNYAMKHDPFVYFNDIRNNAARCAAHVVPFTQFSGDLSSGQAPNFAWITPNMCNDMHDCSISTGDNWLRGVVPTITGSAAFRNNGALFITWDEGSTSAGCCGDTSGGRVATLVISPKAIPGFRSAIAENHYGLLRTIEDGFRLGHLAAAGWVSNPPLREYFHL